MEYKRRIADGILQRKLAGKGAVQIEGPKWCGKTTTAKQVAASILDLSDENVFNQSKQMMGIDPRVLLKGETPRLIDEWQTIPGLWDSVRSEVDRRGELGQYILTGSSVLPDAITTIHSGTGRYAHLRMRPMSLFESGEGNPAISVKGKKYISTPFKCYFSDLGLRNARLNFRQIEETHLMENAIFNELCLRGFNVDVGAVETRETDAGGHFLRKQPEVDFVVNQGSRRYYIQSAYALPTESKAEQEVRPLRCIQDSFKKIIVVKDDILLRRNEEGIVTMGLRQFLCEPESLDL